MAEAVTIKGRLEATDTTPVYHVVKFPKAKLASFEFKRGLRRVICSINGGEPYHCVVFPSKENYFVTVNKQNRDRLGIGVGDAVTLVLRKDESEFGTPVAEEFAEVLRQDPAGDKYFRALNPGDQRILLKLIDLGRGVDARVARSLAAIELLKALDGKFDYHATNNAMRTAAKMAGGNQWDH